MQERRSTSGIFAGKYGLITLRDLFRWAERYVKSEVKEKFHDWDQQLAEDGKCSVYIPVLRLLEGYVFGKGSHNFVSLHRFHAAGWEIEGVT